MFSLDGGYWVLFCRGYKVPVSKKDWYHRPKKKANIGNNVKSTSARNLESGVTVVHFLESFIS
jgi:hypothetical protein